MRSNDYIVAVIKEVKEAELAKKQLEDKIAKAKDMLKSELKARKSKEIHVGGWTLRTVDSQKPHFDSKAFKKDFEKLYEQYVDIRPESRFYILKEGH